MIIGFSSFALIIFGFISIGVLSHYLGRNIPKIWWKVLEITVVISGFVAVLAALSQISLTRFEKNISDTVILAQTDFRRIERAAEAGMMSCGLWWNDVASWDYLPPDAPYVILAGDEPTSCAVCRIGHMVYQERDTSFGLVSENSQALDRGHFLRMNFCNKNLTDSEYQAICPVVSKYANTVETLKTAYDTVRTNDFFLFGRMIDPWLQYVFMVILGLEFGKILTDIRRPTHKSKI